MSAPPSLKRARIAVSLMFLLCGTAVSSWAPMVPLARQRLGINNAELGLLLLVMGVGAITAMPFVGPMIQKNGSRKILVISSIIAAVTLPFLTIADTALTLGISLYVFGASMGTLDVSMNAQAVVVQEALKKPVMSSFHGMFSVGGLSGAFVFGFLLIAGLSPTIAACVISGMLLLLVLTHHKHFIDHPRSGESEALVFRLPKGPVVLLGIFCFIIFLAEGAMLDWSAEFLHSYRNFDIAVAGAGYSVFSVAMAIMRFTGDRLVHYYGPEKIVLWGALLATAGLIIAVAVPWQAATMAGFLLIGIGAANIVPVLFSAAGKADPSSPELALAAVTTMGYAGQLAGPALIGFAAQLTSLPIALGFLAAPIFLIALSFNLRKTIPSAGA